MAARGRGRGRRWIGLAVLALALSPVLALLVAAPRPSAPEAPAIAAHVTTEGAALPAPPALAPLAGDAAPERTAGLGSQAGRARAAEDGWGGPPACRKDGISGGQYNRCLFEATRTTEQALEAELANAFAVIEARADLAGVQRVRWKSMLDEAQSRFLLYRNFDCQSVAPFEGPRGIGSFEQRALCIIAANIRRAADLHARYVMPAAVAQAPAGPQTRGGIWIHAVAPPLN